MRRQGQVVPGRSFRQRRSAQPTRPCTSQQLSAASEFLETLSRSRLLTSASANETNANPRHRPVCGSFMTWTDDTAPNGRNVDNSSCSSVPQAKLPMNTFRESIGKIPELMHLACDLACLETTRSSAICHTSPLSCLQHAQSLITHSTNYTLSPHIGASIIQPTTTTEAGSRGGGGAVCVFQTTALPCLVMPPLLVKQQRISLRRPPGVGKAGTHSRLPAACICGGRGRALSVQT